MNTKKEPYHIDGELHVSGRTKFLTENGLPAGTTYMGIKFSEVAHGKILGIDCEEARNLDGVVGVFTYKDIPGFNQIGAIALDEPLLPEDEVMYIGQPLAIVICSGEEVCEKAVAAIKVDIEELPPVLTIDDAERNDSFFEYRQKVERGNPEEELKKCDFVLEDTIEGGAQDHMYLETQRVLVVPDEGKHFFVYPASQSPTEIQTIVARVLGLDSKDITVDVKRLGGAFGGKERKATIFACLAAMASYHTGCPVLYIMSRQDDMKFTGKRHPFRVRYKVGFDSEGKIQAAIFDIVTNGGAFTDLSTAVLERFVLNMDGSYYIPSIRVTGKIAKTNLPPNTAFRGFGAPQAYFVIEHVIERIRKHTGKDAFAIRLLNAYKENQLTPYFQRVKENYIADTLLRLKDFAKYDELRKEVEEFNRSHKFEKKGIGVVSLKFGVSFTSKFLNQGSALVWVYTDGSISVSHGAVEMGQEVNTKIAQIVANVFGVDYKTVRVESTNTKRVANTSPTAASTAVDLNGNAALKAATEIRKRLERFAKNFFGKECEDVIFDAGKVICGKEETGFSDFVSAAYFERINLGAQAFYRTPGLNFDREKGRGRPFYYFVYGAALSVVKVDLFTGSYRLEKVYIVHEDGNPINTEIDLGQIQGAFVQGMGWATTEEVLYNHKGENLASNTSVYKIPAITDVPDTFEVEIMSKARKYVSVLGSKGVGEPPFIYGLSVLYALQDAVESVSEHTREAVIDLPATPEKVYWQIKEMQ